MTDITKKDKPARVAKIVGKRFGKLVVTATAGRSALCQCDCGNVHNVYQSNLYSGRSQSCGCAPRGRRASAPAHALDVVNGSGRTKPLRTFLALPVNALGTAEQAQVYDVCKRLLPAGITVRLDQVRAVIGAVQLFSESL